MEELLSVACDEARQALRQVLYRRAVPPVHPSAHAELACAAPRALGVDAQTLAEALELDGTWLESAEGAGGFVNFTLRAAWFEAVTEQPWALLRQDLPVLPPVPVDCPARIDPFDWCFLTALRAHAPDPALAARQDRENPGALLRLTLRRLEQLEGRVTEPAPWTQRRRALLLLLCQWDAAASRKRQAILLEQAARQVWVLGPLALGGPLLRRTRRVLTAGCVSLAAGGASFTDYSPIRHNGGV